MKELLELENILANNHVFLTGGGGVGKSYLTSKLIENYKNKNMQVVVLGSTGISAINITGQTIHSFFAFGICKNTEELLRHDKYNKQRIKEINKILFNANLLIIDEISMVSANLLEMIRYRLNAASFNGSILFVGDFFQLPPVNKKQDNSLFGDEIYAFESSAWKSYNPIIVELKISKRTEDKNFFSMLKEIREGKVTKNTMEFLSSLRNNKYVYDNNPTILFGRNIDADLMNKQKLEEINGELFTLRAKEVLHDKNLHASKIQNWQKSLMVSLDLSLKIGAHVMFCTNKWGKYYNGEQGVVREVNSEYLLVEKDNSLLKVEPHEFTLYESVYEGNEILNIPIVSMFQFPLKLSYAITIHKSQGMSIENLICDIHHIFETSQFYVAISRAKSAKSLCIEYKRVDFENHIKKCILTNEKVKEFYENSQIITIE